ncbi:DUF2057 domain-containing protein [Vibrio sp. S4M6]|uniref:DUF2057 family protein n=1 Tax=Vibrio sinus TaxID=2946865 RepID=UPI00202A1D1F|nr:DUF2057 family protein [Vibrio sinus]MCL9782332.1 DUF2057 domain-containing protein [Vibrio sinus]
MLYKKFFLGFFLLAFAGLVSAATLNANTGIEITVLNGEKVRTKSIELQPGDNQIVLEFGSRLQKGAQKEYLSFYPYLAVINSKGYQTVDVSLVSNQYSKVKRLTDDKKPVYVFTSNGKTVPSKQLVLPAPEGAFPYRDVLALVTAYNKKNGLVYESGKIRELKQELEQANGGKSAKGETENILQLKLWYSRANPQERAQFEQWVKQQQSQS